jgi:2-amino-4-hydroxy-6-hydroxymethyldihydropteridine diphosphokinase
VRCLVALGGNLGDRRALLERALGALGRLPRTRLLGRSSLRQTLPERPGDGGPYLNGAALLETSLSPERLLRELLRLERRFGRQRRTGERGPRTVDLDLILVGPVVCRSSSVTLPHPRFRERPFVLGPAAEVAPGLRDPLSGLTLRQLAERAGGSPWSC